MPVVQDDQQPYVTLEQAADLYQIKPRALYAWLRNAQMTPVQIDGRTKGLTLSQFTQLGRAHGRILPSPQLEALERRVQRVEEELANMNKRLATLEPQGHQEEKAGEQKNNTP